MVAPSGQIIIGAEKTDNAANIREIVIRTIDGGEGIGPHRYEAFDESSQQRSCRQ
jgi:hypothetical protein